MERHHKPTQLYICFFILVYVGLSVCLSLLLSVFILNNIYVKLYIILFDMLIGGISYPLVKRLHETVTTYVRDICSKNRLNIYRINDTFR